MGAGGDAVGAERDGFGGHAAHAPRRADRGAWIRRRLVRCSGGRGSRRGWGAADGASAEDGVEFGVKFGFGFGVLREKYQVQVRALATVS